MDGLRISQLAERSGVPATTLRFYETVGLLPAGRTPAGYRVYDETAVERLDFIGTAKRLGLPLEEIAGLLPIWANGSCAEVRDDLRPRLGTRIAEAERSSASLSAFVTTLRRALEQLDALPDRAGRCDPRCGSLGTGAHRKDQAIACSLDGEDVRKRAAQWRVLLEGASQEQISDGIRLTLPAERAGQVAELAVAEQRCCPFFDFRLHLTGDKARLEIRAPADAAGLFAALFTPPAG